ncbi:MAG: hypothetical protein ACLQJR_23125 [Stellaceae bacterium]
MLAMPASRLLAALRCWRRLRREQQQQLAMSDAELRDSRLTRLDALVAARQPTLRTCLRPRPALPPRS